MNHIERRFRERADKLRGSVSETDESFQTWLSDHCEPCRAKINQANKGCAWISFEGYREGTAMCYSSKQKP